MRTVCRLLSIFCMCLIACSAWATRITVQDPTEFPITSSPFQVTFTGSCQDLLPRGNAAYNDKGCFGFVNRTGSDWSALTLTLQTGSPTNGGFDCVSDVFLTQTCTPGGTVLTFSGGDIPSDTLQYFVISEDDLDPSSISFIATPTFATTPEPSAWLLMGTGVLSGFGVIRSRRRVLG